MSTTDTELKLLDTEIQLNLAAANIDNEEIFRSCINSAISMARSVTFVMQSESAYSDELSTWYRETIENHPETQLLKYFNTQRVFTIHKGTIRPSQESRNLWRPQVLGGAAIWGPQSKSVWVLEGTDSYGLGTGIEALTLCQRYYCVLHQLVSAWVAKRSAA